MKNIQRILLGIVLSVGLVGSAYGANAPFIRADDLSDNTISDLGTSASSELSGVLNDETGTGGVAVFSSAPTITGTLTADGITIGQDELITIGAQTITHDGTDFVADDSLEVGGTGTSTFGSGITVAGTGASEFGTNVIPDADGTLDLGVQTTAQWANVWSDLINGADYAFLNSFRILESEKYKGYPEGIAIGNVGFIDGVVTEKAEGSPIFVITEDFIEYKGVRFTKQQLEKLKELVK